jgi:hypothetical protein
MRLGHATAAGEALGVISYDYGSSVGRLGIGELKWL